MQEIAIQLLWVWTTGLLLGAMVICTYVMWKFLVQIFKGEL